MTDSREHKIRLWEELASLRRIRRAASWQLCQQWHKKLDVIFNHFALPGSDVMQTPDELVIARHYESERLPDGTLDYQAKMLIMKNPMNYF